MSSKPVIFHPAVAEESQAAYAWYHRQNPAAAADFLHEIELGVEAISRAPSQYSSYISSMRRYVLKRFPYVIIYRENQEQIEIIAVAHQSRKPGYWKKRL